MNESLVFFGARQLNAPIEQITTMNPNLWDKTPWLVRGYGIVCVALVLIVIIVKVTESLGSAKKNYDQMPAESPLEEQKQVLVTQVYESVDTILRQAMSACQDSMVAQQQGRSLESQVFAMQALAYLESANAVAPKRTRELIPDLDAKIQSMRAIVNEERKRASMSKDPIDDFARQQTKQK